jgi:hypothetical protein
MKLIAFHNFPTSLAGSKLLKNYNKAVVAAGGHYAPSPRAEFGFKAGRLGEVLQVRSTELDSLVPANVRFV